MVIETGKISLKEMEFLCIVGTLPFERENEQPIVLNISLWLDFSAAARNEDLIHSIDYAELSEEVKNFIRMSQFQLVETLVVETGKFILTHHPKASEVEVSVRKPLAIPDCKGAEASVKIRRQ